ncbi:glycosyltransferase [Evansella sp. AB-rgal1]|uniref:glycosyltransferase n=1 Tax=Evansella sp. AB-rgal1 TaxID=3242696 RepID=UPI00359E9DCE
MVPIYCVEKYLRKCVDSVINQTYSNLEIILVDDGSPDNCGSICDEYAMIDKRIKVIHKENGGLSDARNAGLDVATGEYISFIDSDDYIHPEFYEVLLNLIVNNNADIAQCGYTEVYEKSDSTLSIEKKAIVYPKIVVHNDKNDILTNLYEPELEVAIWNVWNKLFKVEILKNIRFPMNRLHEDVFTTYKIFFNANKVVTTEKKMYFYLQRPNSIMRKEFSFRRLDLLDAYYDQVLFYESQSLLKLKEKAINILETSIVTSIIRVIHSNARDKNDLLDYLVSYYKNHMALFSSLRSSKKRNITRLFFEYSPKFGIKFTYKLKEMVKR